MDGLWTWLLDIPKNFAAAGDWLVTPVQFWNVSISPIAMIGASLGVFLTILLVLKIKSLVIA